jgi:hypothetical protein
MENTCLKQYQDRMESPLERVHVTYITLMRHVFCIIVRQLLYVGWYNLIFNTNKSLVLWVILKSWLIESSYRKVSGISIRSAKIWIKECNRILELISTFIVSCFNFFVLWMRQQTRAENTVEQLIHHLTYYILYISTIETRRAVREQNMNIPSV